MILTKTRKVHFNRTHCSKYYCRKSDGISSLVYIPASQCIYLIWGSLSLLISPLFNTKRLRPGSNVEPWVTKKFDFWISYDQHICFCVDLAVLFDCRSNRTADVRLLFRRRTSHVPNLMHTSQIHYINYIIPTVLHVQTRYRAPKVCFEKKRPFSSPGTASKCAYFSFLLNILSRSRKHSLKFSSCRPD